MPAAGALKLMTTTEAAARIGTTAAAAAAAAAATHFGSKSSLTTATPSTASGTGTATGTATATTATATAPTAAAGGRSSSSSMRAKSRTRTSSRRERRGRSSNTCRIARRWGISEQDARELQLLFDSQQNNMAAPASLVGPAAALPSIEAGATHGEQPHAKRRRSVSDATASQPWFHGAISRVEAEQALADTVAEQVAKLGKGALGGTGVDGTFLVRERSAAGNYAISVVVDEGRTVEHHLLSRNAEGSFTFNNAVVLRTCATLSESMAKLRINAVRQSEPPQRLLIRPARTLPRAAAAAV